ncbi:DnaB-like helicase C-terminal domain-containing protein [Egicoccus sp. AB-alg2]|uniref:DnaB-like helicase C-terminal domain-containing protein n=1 Tax=Egicoccus sp. AB-alg2 TaxID=3242693 RepID=UPI00359D956B
MDLLHSLGAYGDDGGLLAAAMAASGYGATSEAARVQVPTGFDDVDRVTGGGLPAGVHLLSGEMACGKTGLVARLAVHCADSETPVLFVCKMDDTVAIAQRMVAAHARIDRSELLTSTGQSADRVQAAYRRLSDQPLAVVPAERLELWSVGWALRELASRVVDQPRLLVIDDLDDLAGGAGQGDLGLVPRSLADMARRLGIAIVVTTTATLIGERRDRRPELRDVHGWPQIAPHLRSAWLLYRADQHDADSPDRGIGEVILAWQANGPTGTVRLAHLPHLGTWANLHHRTGSGPYGAASVREGGE